MDLDFLVPSDPSAISSSMSAGVSVSCCAGKCGFLARTLIPPRKPARQHKKQKQIVPKAPTATPPLNELVVVHGGGDVGGGNQGGGCTCSGGNHSGGFSGGCSGGGFGGGGCDGLGCT